MPNSQNAIIQQEKITGYLLSTRSVRGRSKAIYFERFGFSIERWQDFSDALLVHGRSHEVAGVLEGSHGLLYSVEGVIETPDGRNPHVRTVWQIDYGKDYPRLITAYRI